MGLFGKLAKVIYWERAARNVYLAFQKMSKEWLLSLGIPNDTIHRERVIVLDRPYRVDGFDPKTNTVYEFYGDFWHGNPRKYSSDCINPKNKTTYGELYRRTIERQSIIERAGFNFICIWESDYLERKRGNKITSRID